MSSSASTILVVENVQFSRLQVSRLSLPPQVSADMIHPDRLTPFGKVAIFIGGCVVVALTTLDIHRSIRYNEQPPSREQMVAFEKRIDDVRQNEALRGLSGLPGLRDDEPPNGSVRNR
eukprot:TRINITY_DN1386_c0_g1_i1.p2 TRINITY_DN1386_c0_g1~~TRINITY_DN1386_c0_g1_i1.p2  ORF type:complete len:118 (+),score=3.17 TRINITY_DN1386_c0_g1_i1:170-523(+)